MASTNAGHLLRGIIVQHSIINSILPVTVKTSRCLKMLLLKNRGSGLLNIPWSVSNCSAYFKVHFRYRQGNFKII